MQQAAKGVDKQQSKFHGTFSLKEKPSPCILHRYNRIDPHGAAPRGGNPLGSARTGLQGGDVG